MDISNPTFSLLSYSYNVKSSQQAALNAKHCHSSLLPPSPKWCQSPGLYWLLFLISTPGSGASLSQGGVPRLLLASKTKRCGQTVKECW